MEDRDLSLECTLLALSSMETACAMRGKAHGNAFNLATGMAVAQEALRHC